MEISYLGISFVEALQKLFNTILTEVFAPILKDILEVFCQYFMSVIWSMWSEWLLALFTVMCSLVDFVENIFNVFAGISPVEVGGHQTYLLDAFFQMKEVTTAFTYITVMAVAISFIFTIYKTAKSISDMALEDKNPVSKVLADGMKAAVTFMLIPFLCIALLQISTLVTNQAVSAFDAVVNSLEPMPALRDTEAWFLPVMLIERAHSLKSGGVVKTSDTPLIPKRIHYCWFSGNPIPDSLKGCMETWEKFCPDYEIVPWDESNYDISWSPYMVQAYERKMWGFVPDVARLDILCRYGGIYLDTDVELVRGLDELLYQPAFCGAEKWGQINFGGLSGAEPGAPAVGAILDCRKTVPFVRGDGTLNLTTCGKYETKPLEKLGFHPSNTTQSLQGMTVYSSEFFHPFDYASGETAITDNTFSIHHFSGTWLGEGAALERRRTREKYRQFINRLEE